MRSGPLYRAIWRWHFYAGLFVMPMIVILALTGTVYLFKPQIERWEERAWQDLPTTAAATPSAQRDAALAAFPGARFEAYRLPQRRGDAAMIHLALAPGGAMRDVFVSPQGRVLGALDPDTRIVALAQSIHGRLLLGPRGSWLVELAASWAIVMILSGLYLWWPARGGLAGVVWPRLRRGGRTFWRDLHAVTGFWAAGLALVLLVTGLPWAAVWGGAFKQVRSELGWVKGRQDWTLGGVAAPAAVPALHAEHDHGTMATMPAMRALPGAAPPPASLDAIVRRAATARLAFPVLVKPAEAGWTVASDSQSRPERVTIRFDAGGRETSREEFADKHVIDRVIGYGISWHEGALLGPLNQAIGLATALLLLTAGGQRVRAVAAAQARWRARRAAAARACRRRGCDRCWCSRRCCRCSPHR